MISAIFRHTVLISFLIFAVMGMLTNNPPAMRKLVRSLHRLKGRIPDDAAWESIEMVILTIREEIGLGKSRTAGTDSALTSVRPCLALQTIHCRVYRPFHPRLRSSGLKTGRSFNEIIFGIRSKMKEIIFVVVMASVCRLFAQYDGTISADSAQAVFLGEHPGDLAGHHVAMAPDLNNDGYDELLVTAPLWDLNSQSTSHGRVYLYYGKSQGWNGAISLADADALFHGAYALNEASHDAFGVGDINHDGYHDLAIAIKKTQAPQGGNRLGKVYLYFGKSARLSGEMSLEDADASLVGNAIGAEAAHVKGVGDLDKDGYDDFVIGAGFHPQVGAEAGKIYVFFGKDRSLWTKNADMEAACDASYLAESAGDWAGHRVSGLGDVNGDGYADLLIGANHRPIGDNSYAGTVYLILGRARHLWGKDVSLSQADASWIGETNRQNLGWNVAHVGDVDGDALDDLFFSNGSSTYYLIPAKKLRLDRDMPISSVGATVFTHASKVEDGIGHDITGIGDINLDGFDDFLIGNSLVSDPVMGTAVGKSYLFMGRAEWPASVAMASAKAVFTGEAANDEFG
ncbi:MAG: hypothetical protein EHM72_19305, partial [Calditrichaeota bacterium]